MQPSGTVAFVDLMPCYLACQGAPEPLIEGQKLQGALPVKQALGAWLPQVYWPSEGG